MVIRQVIDNTTEGKEISPHLWGIFLEDLNYAVDGGINSELIQNGAFEYSQADADHWSSLSYWSIAHTGPGNDDVTIMTTDSVAQENPHYVRSYFHGGQTTLTNSGFDGVHFSAEQHLTFSFWARSSAQRLPRIEVRLLDETDRVVASVVCPGGEFSTDWTKLSYEMVPDTTASFGKLQIAVGQENDELQPGYFDIDWASLRPTYSAFGLPVFRDDMVQVLADLKPRFLRFPGGCLAHGLGLENMYEWKNSVGPVEHRHQMFNFWGYHQSLAVGYYEYFCLCEAIGAKPLPVLPAGVCCPNTQGGARPIPQEHMERCIQDVLDLIEFANGDITTPWGAQRAAAGHPESFNLEFLGIGNEDSTTPVFEDRFSQIYRAVSKAHPEVALIGTLGPRPAGHEYEQGWDIARKLGVPIVDEHSYKSPEWYYSHLDRFDDLDREGAQVYLGEYAAGSNTMLSALAEASYMMAAERNGDIVTMTSYAPLFAKKYRTQWVPVMIYFDNETVQKTNNYWVQYLFSRNAGTRVLPSTVEGLPRFERPAQTWTGVQFSCMDHGEFDIDSLVLHDEEGSQKNFLSDEDIRVDASSDFVVPVHMESSNYTISFNVKRASAEGEISVLFGEVSEPDHFMWDFGGWQNRAKFLKKVSDGFMSEISDETLGGVSSGRTYAVKIEVRESGDNIRVFLDDELLHEYMKEGEEKRLSLQTVVDSSNGNLHLRMVNATGETQIIESDFVSEISPEAPVDVEILSGERDEGKPFEESSCAPVITRMLYNDFRSMELPPYSLAMVTIHCKTA